MPDLRTLSARPWLLVDPQGNSLVDPATKTRVGIPGPFGRQRIVAAIPTNEAETGPVQLTAHKPLVDQQGILLADPTTGTLVGEPAIWVHRMLAARWVLDTRRVS